MATLNGISLNRDLLLETYTAVNKSFKAFKKKNDNPWKITASRKKDSNEIVRLTADLIKEMSNLLLEKKTQEKKNAQKNRSQIALDLKTAPVAHLFRDPQPENLVEVVELIGIPFNEEIRSILILLDEQFIKLNSKNPADYLNTLKNIKESIEDFSTDDLDE